MIKTSFYNAGLKGEAPTELAIIVKVSIAWPRSCLYYLVVFVSMMLNKSWAVISKYLQKCYLHISATDEIAPKQLSFTKEIPVEEWVTRRCII